MGISRVDINVNAKIRTLSRSLPFERLLAGLAGLGEVFNRYSSLSTMLGSTRDARHAHKPTGSQLATTATAVIIAITKAIVSLTAALSASQLVKSFLFETQPNYPGNPGAGRYRPPGRHDSRRLYAGKASVPD
jgi:hypothetical protein